VKGDIMRDGKGVVTIDVERDIRMMPNEMRL